MEYKRRERGQSLVEFVLILPVLLIALAGMLDLGRLYFAYVAVTDAAAEGAAYAAIYPDDSDGVKDRVPMTVTGLRTAPRPPAAGWSRLKRIWCMLARS
jgi:Flp pilus assembly protein TadG